METKVFNSKTGRKEPLAISITFDQCDAHSLSGICEQMLSVYQARPEDDLHTLKIIFKAYVAARPGEAVKALELFAKINEIYYATAYHGQFAEKVYNILSPVIKEF